MSRAAWGDKGPRNRRAALLLQGEGKFESYVMWARRLVGHWARMCKGGLLDQEETHEYWDELNRVNRVRNEDRRRGPARGPIHEMHRTLEDWGVETRGPTVWRIEGLWTPVRPGSEFTRLAQHCETNRQWAYLGRTRYNLQGLQAGRDHHLSELHLRRQKTPKGKAETLQVLADGWFTPMRGHQLRGGNHKCGRCGADYADVEHIVWECEVVPTRNIVHRRLAAARAQAGGIPRALWLSGNVPKDHLPKPSSEQMRTEYPEIPAVPYAPEGEQWVGTDGGCRKTTGGPRAGIGIAWEHGETHAWAVPGARQTAQIAEVMAIWCAVQCAPRPLVIVTDSKYVFNTVQKMRQDATLDPGEHGHWWAGIRENMNRIKEIRWQKPT